jgi:hypothetical protein
MGRGQRFLVCSALLAGCLLGTCSCSVLGSSESTPSKPWLIRCQAGPDCESKWKRAGAWVSESSGLKVQTKTDALIKTEQSREDSRTLVLTITKNATPQAGVYEIDLIAGCPSVLSCLPSVTETREKFTNFVLSGNGS